MGISRHSRNVLFACFAVTFWASAGHAGIYKWVDANGQTHYSDSNNLPGRTKVQELRQPDSSPRPAENPPEYWQEQDRRFKERQILKRQEEANKPVVPSRPKSLSGGKVDDGSDIARCNLAKDVLSGAVTHRNGKPTDAYDREVAESNVRAFCH